MGERGKRQAIVCLHVSVTSEHVTQHLRGRRKPWTPSFTQYTSQHIAPTTDGQLQLLGHAFAHNANAVFVFPKFLEFVLEHLFRKASLALLASFAFGLAVLRCLTFAFFVCRMPVMLEAAEDELYVCVVLLLEVLSLCTHLFNYFCGVLSFLIPKRRFLATPVEIPRTTAQEDILLWTIVVVSELLLQGPMKLDVGRRRRDLRNSNG